MAGVEQSMLTGGEAIVSHIVSLVVIVSKKTELIMVYYVISFYNLIDLLHSITLVEGMAHVSEQGILYFSKVFYYKAFLALDEVVDF